MPDEQNSYTQVSADYFAKRGLRRYAGVTSLWALGVGAVISGHYSGWNLGLLTGPLFADRRYEDYFYSVAPRFATADRPAYQARGGYAGTELLAALSKRYPSRWFGAYARYDTLSGASFAASPLVKRSGSWSAGVGIAWIIRQSSRLVEAED